MVRDEEIQRLVNYAKGLGLTVTFSSRKSDCDAEWYLDNSGITIYTKSNSAKMDTILSLIHEIAHAVHNIHEKDRKIDPKFDKALDQPDKKVQRKIVLENETAATDYWHSIYKETNMKFPIWKLEAQMEYDVYQYQVFYETGDFPTTKARQQQLKQIRAKHRIKND